MGLAWVRVSRSGRTRGSWIRIWPRVPITTASLGEVVVTLAVRAEIRPPAWVRRIASASSTPVLDRLALPTTESGGPKRWKAIEIG